MRVAKFIKKLEELGYDEKTNICFGFYNYDGDWYNFNVEEIKDNDRKIDVDSISVVLEPNEEYNESILQEANIDLKEDLRILIQKYC